MHSNCDSKFDSLAIAIAARKDRGSVGELFAYLLLG